MKVRFAEQAEADLIDIGSYIAQDSVETALQFITKLETVCHETLGNHPEIGTKRDDLIAGLRLFPIQKYLIFYRLQGEWLEVVRVLHASRDMESIFS